MKLKTLKFQKNDGAMVELEVQEIHELLTEVDSTLNSIKLVARGLDDKTALDSLPAPKVASYD